MSPWSKELAASYFRRIPDEALEQSVRKPFSQSDRGRLLVESGTVISLLPGPPARILDLGCGTGWTSSFFAQCGYEVLGVDFAPEAIDAARAAYRVPGDFAPEAIDAARAAYRVPGLSFAVHDWDEPLPPSAGRFDAAVFIDCLHHAMDEAGPLRTAHDALVDGGTCIVCEPGTGHADSAGSRHAREVFGVNERDMPPPQVVAAGLLAGFHSAMVLLHPQEVHRSIYETREGTGTRERLLASGPGGLARVVRAVTTHQRDWGVVVLSR